MAGVRVITDSACDLPTSPHEVAVAQVLFDGVRRTYVHSVSAPTPAPAARRRRRFGALRRQDDVPLVGARARCEIIEPV
jgi:hypothetical protein